MSVLRWLQVALKALSLKGIKDWKQLELFQREAVVLQVWLCRQLVEGRLAMPLGSVVRQELASCALSPVAVA
jgi:hypothetical protein